LIGLLTESALLVNYQGHANVDRFTHESLILDAGNSINADLYTDIRGLRNLEKPFIFEGYACWISDFQRRAEGSAGVQDAIGEKLVLNPEGGASACFASGCSEIISTNRTFNPFVTRAMFSQLQGFDPQGRPIPARILMGEVVVTGLVRYGRSDYALRHILFGDPAMIVDMGPPSASATVDGLPVDPGYVYEGATFDTLEVIADIKDEEAIMTIALDLIEGGVPRPVPADSFSSVALTDLTFPRSRSYRTTYRHVPVLGDYILRFSGDDYSGKQFALDIGVRTGSADFFRDQAPLPKDGSLVFGQTLRAVLKRPFPFTQADIAARIDTIPAGEFEGYAVRQMDTEGKEWEVALRPRLDAGSHIFEVEVGGFAARRAFIYVPLKIDIFADGRTLYENDFTSPAGTLKIVVLTELGLTADDIRVELDQSPYPVTFQSDTSGTEWRGFLDLASAQLLPGAHALAVNVREVSTTRNFRISEELNLENVSVFPNPFSSETYFYYTLSEAASEAKLSIYTISGRKIFEADVGTHPGYNQYRWDGLDMTHDRVANGTYIYKLVIKGDGGEREFIERLVKLD